MDEDLVVALWFVHVQQETASDGTARVEGLVRSGLDQPDTQVGRHSERKLHTPRNN